jgi:hypothetical protein
MTQPNWETFSTYVRLKKDFAIPEAGTTKTAGDCGSRFNLNVDTYLPG